MEHVVQSPILQALVLAERIYHDREGQKIIAGTFNVFGSTDFPIIHPGPASMFIALTECQGKIPLSLRFVDLDTNETFAFRDFVIDAADDPLITYEILLKVSPLPLPHAGCFAFDLIWSENQDRLGSLRVHVNQIPKPS